MTIKRWRAGEPLRAPRLNETVDAVNTLVGLLPARLRDAALPKTEEAEVSQETDNAETDEDQAAADDGLTEQWIFLSSDTSTTRIEDPDDSTTFVDVTKTTAIRFIRPDGTIIVLPLE